MQTVIAGIILSIHRGIKAMNKTGRIFKVVARDIFSQNKRIILHQGLREECEEIVKALKTSIRYSEIYYTEV
jgi:hypothetical protein